MANKEAETLMQLAWGRRNASLDAEPSVRRVLSRQAKEELTRAVALFREEESTGRHAQALHLLARMELDAGDEARAQSHWDEAVGLLRGAHLGLQLGHTLRHLGDLHLHCQRLADAERCYGEALTLYREAESCEADDLADALRCMAQLKERRSDGSQALALWREARELYGSLHRTSDVQEADEHIARLAA